MIQSISLQDFLSFKEATIEFSKGITVLVGESFAGKSNVLRAIEELIIGPSTDIVRASSKAAYLAGEINGHHVTRSKGKKLNLYSIGDIDFKSPGKKLPDELKELVNLAWLDGTCISIATQTGKRFLLDETGSAAAKHLATISGLEKLLQAIDAADRDQRKIKTNISVYKENIKELKQDKKKTKEILQHSKEITQLKDLKNKINETESDLIARKTKLSRRKDLMLKRKSLRMELMRTEKEIKDLIADTDICPLSGGPLFDECKGRIIDV